MKKILFIGNITNRITNVAIPSIEASQQLGFEFHMAGNFSGFKDDEKRFNVTLHHLDIVRNPLSLRNIKAFKQMLTLLKKEKFDVIHCNTPIGGILGRVCGTLAKVPKVIYTAHGFHFYKGAPIINKTLFKWAEKWMAHFTDALITMNREDYQSAQSFKLRKGGNVYYVPGVGIDTKFYQIDVIDKKSIRNSLALKEDDIILIAMGDLIKRKNYETAIKAIANIGNEKLHFLICGDGPQLSRLKALAENLGVGKQIHFLGFRTDIKELLLIADIFLFSTYQEGLPRSLMEAMASGLPCIVSNIRGNVDLIENGEGGYICEPNDFEEFASSIEKLTANSELRRRMGKNNLKNILKYDVSRVKTIIKDIYIKELNNLL